MKLTILFLLILSGCGKDMAEKDKNTNPPEYSKQELRTCGYENSRIIAPCMPMADYIIASNRALPSKVKVSLVSKGRETELFNECTNPRVSSSIIRNQNSGFMTFEAIRKRYYEGVHLEISDLGENCDNDAIFFSAFIKPDVELVANDRDMATFNLGN